MEQLSLFNHGISPSKKDLSIFNDDIEIKQEYENEPILKKECPKHLIEDYYVRTKDNNTYHIDGLSKPQRVFAGYEIKRNYKGEKYRKEVYKMKERGYAYIYKDGKTVKEIIRHEDIIAQSPFLIDLCYKNDYVVSKDGKVYYIEHKEYKKPIEIEKFRHNDYTGIMEKSIVKYSRSFLICNKIILREEDITGLVYNPPFDYTKYLIKGAKIKSDYWGWSVITKVMSGKVLCSNDRTTRPFFVYFNQITDVIDYD